MRVSCAATRPDTHAAAAGAPIGSCLVGPKDFIRKARWFRKLFGGGMRQTGVLAGAAAYALTHNFPKLAQVHALARTLEEGLREIGVRIMSGADTCMVFYDPAPIGTTYDEIAVRASELEEHLVSGGSRLVVHIQTTPEAVQDFLSIVRSLKEEKAKAGFVPSADILASAPTDVYVRRMPKVCQRHWFGNMAADAIVHRTSPSKTMMSRSKGHV